MGPYAEVQKIRARFLRHARRSNGKVTSVRVTNQAGRILTLDPGRGTRLRFEEKDKETELKKLPGGIYEVRIPGGQTATLAGF